MQDRLLENPHRSWTLLRSVRRPRPILPPDVQSLRAQTPRRRCLDQISAPRSVLSLRFRRRVDSSKEGAVPDDSEVRVSADIAQGSFCIPRRLYQDRPETRAILPRVAPPVLKSEPKLPIPAMPSRPGPSSNELC